MYFGSTITPPGEEPSGILARTLLLPEDAGGNYTLQVFGVSASASNATSNTASGFTINIVGHDSQFTQTETRVYGAVSPGQTAEYQVIFDPGRDLRVTQRGYKLYLPVLLKNYPPGGGSCLAESPHPYPDNYDNTWTLTNLDTNAASTRIHFSRLETESGYDYVYVQDANNNQINSLTGKYSSGVWSDPVPGRTVKVQLTSDGSVAAWGFCVDRIETVNTGGTNTPTPTHTPTATVTRTPMATLTQTPMRTPGPPANITVTANPSSIPVGGSTSTIRANVMDAGGNPVADGTVVTFTTSLGTIAPPTRPTSNGLATVTLASGYTAGVATVTATAGVVSGTTTVLFPPSPPQSVVVIAYPLQIPADGLSTSAITATVTDRYGNPVADGTVVTLTTSLGAISPHTTITTYGVVVATLTSGSNPGTATVTAQAGSAVGTTTVTFAPTATPTATLATGNICVLVYNDLNGNGLRDPGEPLLPGVTITVTNSSGVVGIYTTNGVNEPHCFTGLPPDTYTVREQNPPGYPISTMPDTWAATLSPGATVTVAFGDQALPTPTPTRTPTATPTGMLNLVVNSTNDVDDGTCNATHCSLREALNAATIHAGPDTVTFNIPTTDPGYDPATGVWTIRPNNTGYNVPADTTVDGSIGTALASLEAATRPGIEIDGTTLGQLGYTGLWLFNNVTLRGLVVNDFQYGIWVASANVTIEGCYVGTDPTGTLARPNGADGILVANGATGAIIQGNLLSGNSGGGIRLFGENTTGNTLRNNRVGTDATGTVALPNGSKGVYLHAGAHNNTIGPDNLIAFNNWEGVLVDGAGTRGNTISRNRIHSNAGSGIRLTNGGNDGLASPVITAASTTQVSGTSCANCIIEVFSDAADEGAIYEGSTTANAVGNWTFTKSGGLTGPYVTTTATDGQGNTSEFSAPASVSQAPTTSPLA
jgi:CSLREA domain-containing protein